MLVLELWPAACFGHAPTANHQERSEAVSNSLSMCMNFPPCHNLQSGIGPRRGRRAVLGYNSTKSQIQENPPYFVAQGVGNCIFDIPLTNSQRRSQSNEHVSGEHRGVHGEKLLNFSPRGGKYLIFTQFGSMVPVARIGCEHVVAVLFGHSLLLFFCL